MFRVADIIRGLSWLDWREEWSELGKPGFGQPGILTLDLLHILDLLYILDGKKFRLGPWTSGSDYSSIMIEGSVNLGIAALEPSILTPDLFHILDGKRVRRGPWTSGSDDSSIGIEGTVMLEIAVLKQIPIEPGRRWEFCIVGRLWCSPGLHRIWPKIVPEDAKGIDV